MESLGDALVARLSASGHPFRLLQHSPAVSAAEAAAARGTPLDIGGKSIVMKLYAPRPGVAEELAVLVVGSDRRIDGRLLRSALGLQRYRFLSADELLALTGLSPGEVPPFGRPLIEAALIVGEDLMARPEIAFAAASRERSVRMATADWAAVAQPRVVAPFTIPG